MKHLLPGVTALGIVIAAAPAFAQQCDSAGARRPARGAAGARHQVLAPRESARAGAHGGSVRRVRMADGSVRVSKYVTKSGVRVAKQKPGSCPAVAAKAPVKTPGDGVGDVVPQPAPAPVTAAGEVLPPIIPTVGSRVGLPLIAGLLLGGTAIAVGSHTPTAAATTPVTTPTTPSTPGAPGIPGTPSTPTAPTPPPPATPPATPPTVPPTTPPATPPTTPPTSTVPEPATVVLLGGGLAFMAATARRRR